MAKEIEKLTEDTRYRLDQSPDGRKAIGIVDAQAAALAEARAECERLRAQRNGAEGAALTNSAKCIGLESRLAAANALLERWMAGPDGTRQNLRLFDETRAHLAGQEPVAECNYRGRCNSSRCPKHGTHGAPTRTEAERLVLDAMADAEIERVGGKGTFTRSTCVRFKFEFELQEDAVCRAELARRGLK